MELPETDIAGLIQYGVTASMDFRGSGEAAARPSDLRERMPYYHKPLFNEAAMAGATFHMPETVNWGEQYIAMAEGSRRWAGEVLAIAAENPGALLYHCTTGKDRTGLMSCYLLSIAGVGREDIAADYCVSQIFLAPVYEKMRSGKMKLGPLPGTEDGKEMPPMPKMDRSFFETPASAMLTLIDYLEKNYGGVTAYLKRIGISETLMVRIREKFVEA